DLPGQRGFAFGPGTAPRLFAGLLVVLGLARVEDAERGFGLTGRGAELVDGTSGSIAEIVRKEWFFYRVWAELPKAIGDGHARIAPWRERLRDDPAQSLAFLRALDDLAARFGAGLPELAGLERGGRLLDVGGGAGSHSAYLEAAVPGLEATVLDLPAAEEVLRERHPELGFVAGDFDEERFGRPSGELWDHVLIANLLHDHPPQRCRELIAEAAGLLAPGGTLLIYDWVLGEDRVTPPDVAVFALMMLVENEGGGTWTEGEIRSWVEAAGLRAEPLRRDPGPIAVLRATRPG
ncbi:MAG: methyltransferase domain-containing protein, partial [Acidobacteria bacterium]